MGMALAAIADDGDFLILDQFEIGVTIVVNTHAFFLFRHPLKGAMNPTSVPMDSRFRGNDGRNRYCC